MDSYSGTSEFIESLDFLSPPVKRLSSSRQAFGSGFNTNTNDVHLLRDFRNKIIRRAPCLTGNSRPVKHSESSTSLILKKTSEGQILGQQYSFVSFPSLHQTKNNNTSLLKSEKKPKVSNKPLIKVTVIPKTDSVQAAKLFRRRRHAPTKVQSTSSNHENSIQTKNVFLIVAGRRKEKIYEIKTTGSAKLSSDHDSYSKHEDIPIVELAHFKNFIQSLNMDKKKKKEKKATVETSEVPQTKVWNPFPECNNCVCVQDTQGAPKKSRVRIFGQFGISEDDKYVLRYGATVNDKQVMSDVAQLARDFSPVIANTSYGTTEEPLMLQQDSNLQADYNFDVDVEKPPVMDKVSKESQGTQVNFNVQVTSNQARCATFSDKRTQCSCCGNKSENNTLKDCQSPMVIISVYPKPSPEDLMNIICPTTITRSPSPVGTYTTNQVYKTEKAPTKSDTRRNNKSPLRSRSTSPAPAKKLSRSKVPDDSNKSPINEKRSPDRQKALKAIKDKIREKDKLKQEASPRKLPVKSNLTNATQVSKNLQNVTVSNATQVSKRNQRQNTRSQGTQASEKNDQPDNTANATQVSAKRIKKYTATNGTQYSNESNATQCEDNFGSRHDVAPVKYSIDEGMVPKKYPQRKSSSVKPVRTQVSNATQVPKIIFSTHATQVSRSDPLMNSCATQVTKPHPNVASRMGKNQETFIPKPPQDFIREQTSRIVSKPKAESGTNTEQARAKKALVETYTKQLTEQMYQSDYIPARFDSSKVTINIDGDREYYNVLFNQDKLTTDLTIRKTVKEMGVPKGIDESSLGSLLGLPDYMEREGYLSGNNSPIRHPPPVLSKSPSDDELPLRKHGSRLTIHDIRDSLEICHRREDEKSISNLKNTQAFFTAQVGEASKFSAPIKHFPGDDCSICDPIERDKQIRELLGVDNVKTNFFQPSQGRSCDRDVGNPFKCIYRQRCKESQVTAINYGFHKACPCFAPVVSKNTATASVQCQNVNCKARHQKQISTGESAVYQQLILNRNIQVFLQLEQFSKQKPIVLSRKQYDKVKKTIQKTISTKKSSHVKRNTLLSKLDSSEISVGEVRTKKVKCPGSPQEKTKDQTKKTNHVCQCNQTAIQTDPSCCKEDCVNFKKSTEKISICQTIADGHMKGDHSTDDCCDQLKKEERKKTEPRTIGKQQDVGERKGKVDCADPCNQNKLKTELCECDDVEVKQAEFETFVLYNAENKRDNFNDATETEHVDHTRKTMSSVQIRYTSVAFMKQAPYSSTDVGAISDSSIDHLNSFQTLFRGRRKSATPNLGTSAYSLYSEDGNNSENRCTMLDPQDSKPKKPFLRRLMSCLVMRSTRDSVLKLPVGPPPKLPSLNSSIDSYHISTSLGAVEVSSSIYDTSASFYSNHTIFPVNSKIKRGFFSSVRGFLTNRKS